MRCSFTFLLAGLASVVISFSAHAHEVCEFSLETPIFQGMVQLKTGREIFVQIEAPTDEIKGWYLLVHGLLDSHHAFDELTPRLLAEGYGVIRLDIYGFGKSIDKKQQVYIDYQDNVTDLKALLILLKDQFKIERPQLAGHSMGGGLVLALLADRDVPALVAPQATVFAPYVYRNEFYMAEKAASLGFGTPYTISSFDEWVPRVFKMGTEYWIDSLVTAPQMHYLFSAFLKGLQAKRPTQLDPEQQIRVAIASVKGLRDLNSIAEVGKIPRSIRLTTVLGKKDEVVELQLARKLGRRIEDRGGEMIELNSGHMVIDEDLNQAVQILLRKL